MSYNRLMYDSKEYKTDLLESKKPLEYQLFKKKYETNKCAMNIYTNNIKFVDRARVENELYGLRKNDKNKSQYEFPKLSPQIICQGIYHITPTNLSRESPKPVNFNTNIV